MREAANLDEEIRQRVKNHLHPSHDESILTSPPIQEEISLDTPEESGSDTESDTILPTLRPRRGPSRKAKLSSINYSDQRKYTVKNDHAHYIHQKDTSYITTTDVYASNSRSSSTTRHLDANQYVTQDDMMTGHHPYSFVAKLQTHTLDMPTYNEVLNSDPQERVLWDKAMDKELKTLADLGSFKMVQRPKGENILQSTWAFKRKRYPDGSLQKYKARFCVRGDQ